MKKALLSLIGLLLCVGLGAQQKFVENFKGEFVRSATTVKGIPLFHVNALCTDGDILYASAWDEIYALDISDPHNPVILSKIKVYGLVRQMVVQNGTLFAAARESGCWFIDAHDPGNLSLITRYDTVELSTGIDVAGNVLFLGTRQNGVEFVDITDVQHPVHIRMEKTYESQSVCYRDGILYSGEWGAHCVTVIDARDMEALKTVKTVNLQGYGDGVWLCGNYLYVSTGHHLVSKGVSKEDGHGAGHGMEIFDVTDPWNPVFVSRVSFDRIFSGNNDYWTPRPCSDGRYVVCADTVNGLYVVDASDPQNPETISRVHFLDKNGKAVAVNSVAIAKGVVFAATWRAYGLVLLDCPDAFPNVIDKGQLPQNASYRLPYTTPESSHFAAWKPESGAPVRAVAAKDDILFAACSYGGLAIFQKGKDGRLVKIGEGPKPFAGDVKVRGKRLYVAEGPDGLGIYAIGKKGALKEEARYTDFMKDGPLAQCIWVYVPNDDWVLASTRDFGYYYISLKRYPVLEFVAKKGDNPGWDRYPCAEPDSKGMLPATRPYQGIAWVDLNTLPIKEKIDGGFRPTLFDGICRYKGDSFITVDRGRLYIYTSDQIGEKKDGIDMGDRRFRGFPVWDGAGKLALTLRIGGEIRMFDFTDDHAPKLLWMEKTDGYPETSIFWKGKLTVPCGYQGLLIEK
ncbi:MAG: hypothetical protein J5632_04005 [Bacteroidales bacterium]|nr:hypothetical protein [Bacteroidales bacterium]